MMCRTCTDWLKFPKTLDAEAHIIYTYALFLYTCTFNLEWKKQTNEELAQQIRLFLLII